MDDDHSLKRRGRDRSSPPRTPSPDGDLSGRQQVPGSGEMTVRREVRGVQVIEVYGEIDLAVVSALDHALDAAILALEGSGGVRLREPSALTKVRALV